MSDEEDYRVHQILIRCFGDKCFGDKFSNKNPPFKVGIWNWFILVENTNQYMHIHLFPEECSDDKPPIARFVLRLSSFQVKRDPIVSPVHERLLRTSKDFVWHVDSAVDDSPYILEVEFLDLKICPLNGGEIRCIWPTERTRQIEASVTESTRGFLHELNGSMHDVITIKTADGTLTANKMLLSMCSPVFESMFLHNMKERDSSSVEINDMSLESCAAFLGYVYGTIKQEDFWKHRLALLGAANKYCIGGLKSICEESLLEDIDSGNVLERLQEAFLYQLDKLKKACMTYLYDKGFINKISIFKHADRALVEVIFEEMLALETLTK